MKKPRRSSHPNNNQKSYGYGKCHVCGEQMQEQRINQDFWLKGKLVVIEKNLQNWERKRPDHNLNVRGSIPSPPLRVL
jgi:hypothetical protein